MDYIGDYCSSNCVKSAVPDAPWMGAVKSVVDCRNQADIEAEKTYSPDTMQHLRSPWERGTAASVGLPP